MIKVLIFVSFSALFVSQSLAHSHHGTPHSCADNLSPEIKNLSAKKAYDFLKESLAHNENKLKKKTFKSLNTQLSHAFNKLSQFPESLKNSPGLSQVFSPWFEAIVELQAHRSQLNSQYESEFLELLTFHIKFLNVYLTRESLSGSQKAIILDQISSLNTYIHSGLDVYFYEFKNAISRYYDYNEVINCL